MKEYDESGVVPFFELFNMLSVDGCSDTWLLRHLTMHEIRSR